MQTVENYQDAIAKLEITKIVLVTVTDTVEKFEAALKKKQAT